MGLVQESRVGEVWCPSPAPLVCTASRWQCEDSVAIKEVYQSPSEPLFFEGISLMELMGVCGSGDHPTMWEQLVAQHSSGPEIAKEDLLGMVGFGLCAALLLAGVRRHGGCWSRRRSSSHLL